MSESKGQKWQERREARRPRRGARQGPLLHWLPNRFVRASTQSVRRACGLGDGPSSLSVGQTCGRGTKPMTASSNCCANESAILSVLFVVWKSPATQRPTVNCAALRCLVAVAAARGACTGDQPQPAQARECRGRAGSASAQGPAPARAECRSPTLVLPHPTVNCPALPLPPVADQPTTRSVPEKTRHKDSRQAHRQTTSCSQRRTLLLHDGRRRIP
jgi:hypothetical protein